MRQVRGCLVATLDRILDGRRTVSKSGELRKDVPHPMCTLPTCPTLLKRLFVIALLRPDEPSQVPRIVAHKPRTNTDHSATDEHGRTRIIQPRMNTEEHGSISATDEPGSTRIIQAA